MCTGHFPLSLFLHLFYANLSASHSKLVCVSEYISSHTFTSQSFFILLAISLLLRLEKKVTKMVAHYVMTVASFFISFLAQTALVNFDLPFLSFHFFLTVFCFYFIFLSMTAPS